MGKLVVSITAFAESFIFTDSNDHSTVNLAFCYTVTVTHGQ